MEDKETITTEITKFTEKKPREISEFSVVKPSWDNPKISAPKTNRSPALS